MLIRRDWTIGYRAFLANAGVEDHAHKFASCGAPDPTGGPDVISEGVVKFERAAPGLEVSHQLDVFRWTEGTFRGRMGQR